jgi:predicted nucleotidyltransferase
MIDVQERHLTETKKILAEHVPDCEVRAFGSRIAGRAKPWSDLDLAVVGAEALTLRRLGLLVEAFQESTLPFRVDVLDWHEVSPSFQKIIDRQYEVIQKGHAAGVSQ